MLLGRVVDHHVELAELGDRLPDRVLAERLVADIAAEEDHLAALRLDQFGGILGVVVLFQIDDSEPGALAGEQHRDGAADAAVATRDDRHLAFEPATAAELRQIFGRRQHLVFAAGLPELLLGGGMFDVFFHRWLLICNRDQNEPQSPPFPLGDIGFSGSLPCVSGLKTARTTTARTETASAIR
jgi:hypothetical protein